MSSFYYCLDCKKDTSITNKIGVKKFVNPVCSKCGGTNWHAMIDSPGGYPKIHPGSTHRVGDIEKLNRKE